MKQFYDFLDSISKVNPTLVEGVKKAHQIIYEGLGTEEALDEADMKLEQNTEAEMALNPPDIEPSIDDSISMSDEYIPLDAGEELGAESSLDDMDLSTPDELPVIDDGIE